jgi:hypothetical protein
MECTRHWSLIGAMLSGSLFAGWAHSTQAPPAIEAYGQLPGVELVRLSPSGRWDWMTKRPG